MLGQVNWHNAQFPVKLYSVPAKCSFKSILSSYIEILDNYGDKAYVIGKVTDNSGQVVIHK